MLCLMNSQRFQGYCCESGIALFAWRVTLNCACTVPLIPGLKDGYNFLIKGLFRV